MHLVRSAFLYALAASMIFGAYHVGSAAASLLNVSSHAMAPAVPITADIAERVA